MKRKRWIVKAGSQMVCEGGPILLRAWMQQVATLRKKYNIEIIWVTSGAIASAVDRTGFRKKSRKLAEKQALSAIGQPMIMDLYNIALQATGLMGAQILLTYDDLSNSGRRKNFQNTVKKLLEWEITPILNENDAVATEEIRFGDNDSLSAKVAKYTFADRLIILTDVEGLYDSDPKKNPRARLISELHGVSMKLLAQTPLATGTTRGTGGMHSKLRAAQEATQNKIDTWLVKGDRPSVLVEIAKNLPVGTRISSKK